MIFFWTWLSVFLPAWAFLSFLVWRSDNRTQAEYLLCLYLAAIWPAIPFIGLYVQKYGKP